MNDFEKDIRCELCFRNQSHTKSVHEKALAMAEKEERQLAADLSKQLNKQRVS